LTNQIGAGETLPLSDFANQKVRRDDEARVKFNIALNSARDIPWIGTQKVPHDRPIVFVGNAPSVANDLRHIRRRQRRGAEVWTVNGAHDYLIDNGITPDAALFCDPADRMPTVVQKLNDETIYMVASCCSPAFFDHLAGRKVLLWHMNNEFGEEKFCGDLGRVHGKFGAVFSGGSTCILRAPSVAYFLGYRDFHFYGVDSSFDGPSHVNRDDSDLFGVIFNVECNGRIFRTNVPLARQAEEFALLHQVMSRCGAKFHVHGSGLLPFRFRQARIAFAPKERMKVA